jgi:carboxyl-terminal processing protease
VLVNNQSASASELVAAALQDYNRAVIVGGATYGKATMQQVLPVDSNASSAQNPVNGFVKVTTGKLYRINGKTAQARGVIPDIHLPDAFEGLEFSEQFLPNALPADTVKRNNYYKSLTALPIAPLAAASHSRLANDVVFTRLAASISKRKSDLATGEYIVPLQPAAFEKWEKNNEANFLEENDKPNSVFVAANYGFEKERLKHSDYESEMNAAILERIQKDAYVQEAYQVIRDLIELLKK